MGPVPVGVVWKSGSVDFGVGAGGVPVPVPVSRETPYPWLPVSHPVPIAARSRYFIPDLRTQRGPTRTTVLRSLYTDSLRLG